MPLLVIGKTPPAGKREGTSYDTYLEKLLKLIPAEIVALYLTGIGLVPQDLPENQKILLPIWVAFCFILVIVVRYKATSDQTTPANWKLIAISSVAFIIWSYSLGGAYEAYNLYFPYLGSLAVLGWTAAAPILYGDL